MASISLFHEAGDEGGSQRGATAKSITRTADRLEDSDKVLTADYRPNESNPGAQQWRVSDPDKSS